MQFHRNFSIHRNLFVNLLCTKYKKFSLMSHYAADWLDSYPRTTSGEHGPWETNVSSVPAHAA